jgi:hypothetical protein
MSPSLLTHDHHPATPRALRPLLGSVVTVRTTTATLHGLLLSCVKGSVWLVADDTDVVVHADDIVSVSPR